jgi:hypothetical protein
MPNTVPSEEARQRPLVVMAKNTYPTISSPHSTDGVVAVPLSPGKRQRIAETAPMVRKMLRKPSQSHSERGNVRVSARTERQARRHHAFSASRPM